KAREEIRRGVGLDPGNIDGWVRLATVSHMQGDYNGRDAALRNAASLPNADLNQLRTIRAKMDLLGAPPGTAPEGTPANAPRSRAPAPPGRRILDSLGSR